MNQPDAAQLELAVEKHTQLLLSKVEGAFNLRRNMLSELPTSSAAASLSVGGVERARNLFVTHAFGGYAELIECR